MDATLTQLLSHLYQQEQTVNGLSAETQRLMAENARLTAELDAAKQVDEPSETETPSGDSAETRQELERIMAGKSDAARALVGETITLTRAAVLDTGKYVWESEDGQAYYTLQRFSADSLP